MFGRALLRGSGPKAAWPGVACCRPNAAGAIRELSAIATRPAAARCHRRDEQGDTRDDELQVCLAAGACRARRVCRMITKSVPARAHTRTFAVGIDYITQHTHQRAVAAAGAQLRETALPTPVRRRRRRGCILRGVMSVETAAIEMEAVAALSVSLPRSGLSPDHRLR